MKRAASPAPAPVPAPDGAQAPAAGAEPELPPLLGDGAAPSLSKTAAPVHSKAYVGRTSALGGQQKPLNDILPFKWIDLLVLVPAIGGLLWWMKSDMQLDSFEEHVIAVSIFLFAALALYGALVFPFRYYLRRRPVMHALRNYTISSLILFACAVTPFLIADIGFGRFPYDEPATVLLYFGVVWVAFAILAFTIYGVLAAQRALRSFRSNIKKIA
jgi:hypothetical protein